ncbi:MAG: 50S ribosomal protein L17 [Bacteroidia bacterium]|nr:50S ribosomal protein L17 [Bacteroidia bacterium]
MRHGKKFNHLSRKSAHRKAMLANMACSLIEHKRIKTTVAKAKALRKYVEPIITKSKTDTMHSRRVVFSYLKNKEAVKELFGTVADKIADRPGGYTRILKIGNRLGDNAELAMIELVDFNELALESAPSKGKKKSRRRRGGGKGKGKPKAEATAVVEEAEVIEEAEVVEEAVDQVEEVVEETVEEVAEAAEEVAEEVVEEAPAEVEAAVEEVVEEAAPEVEAAVEEVVEEAPAAEVEADDLTKIEGIGPKIKELLIAAGLPTFASVAAATPEQIKEVLTNAGSRYARHNPGTWPKQAEMAAAGQWDELKKWQDELDGGKE